ncbi:DNA repair exonuclease [Acetivibrio sp. MSJd-27]|uniref:metallophosphoesterase family protein n=1 Tax=Acetivibrio sp. MSJd-27 TaxID=2841523 RepID=UPI001C115006|nr:DNA repair exonuclease [Acetivibrio sp. MSJd-27]MBU5451466.1 DNA repair exonuclease [Acetivibrio sp. MSJd-27]
MIKLIHFADLHLNAPLSSRVGWDTANKLRENKFKVIDRIVALANDKQADMILIAGDLFDDSFTDEKTFRFLEDRFSKTNASIFIVCGNHDCLSKSRFYDNGSSWKNTHIFNAEMGKVSLPALNCDVYGQSFSGEVVRESMLKGFRADNPETLNLMVMHGDLHCQSDYNPIRTEDIAASGLDYLALGHIHNEKQMKREGRTYYGYSGIPQPHSFKDSSAPSVNYIELSKQEFHVEYIDVSEFRFYRLRVSVSECLTSYDIQRAILHAAESYDKEKNLFEITMEGELPEGFYVDIRQMEEELSDSFLHLELRNETRLAVNFDALKREQTLRGAFVRLVMEDETLTDKEKREIMECGIHAVNPLVSKEGLL